MKKSIISLVAISVFAFGVASSLAMAMMAPMFRDSRVCAQPPVPPCPVGMACPQVMPAPKTYFSMRAMRRAGAQFLYSGPCSYSSVPPTQTAPNISSVSPTQAMIWDIVTISGSGFTVNGTSVYLHGSLLGTTNSSIHGWDVDFVTANTLTFKVPDMFIGGCGVSGGAIPTYTHNPCDMIATPVNPGTYDLQVVNEYGKSNVIAFTVTATPIAMCDYPGAPLGCLYLKGPEYNPITNCGMVLACRDGAK